MSSQGGSQVASQVQVASQATGEEAKAEAWAAYRELKRQNPMGARGWPLCRLTSRLTCHLTFRLTSCFTLCLTSPHVVCAQVCPTTYPLHARPPRCVLGRHLVSRFSFARTHTSYSHTHTSYSHTHKSYSRTHTSCTHIHMHAHAYAHTCSYTQVCVLPLSLSAIRKVAPTHVYPPT